MVGGEDGAERGGPVLPVRHLRPASEGQHCAARGLVAGDVDLLLAEGVSVALSGPATRPAGPRCLPISS